MPDPLVQQLDTATALMAAPSACERVTDRVARRFSADLLRQMSRSLPLPEISTVLLAERTREAGLTHARAGRLEEGASQVADARSICRAGRLCEEALAVAETFQLAAESYVHYRAGDYDKARADLYGSMVISIMLGDERRYRMDYRILHLARNVVHLENLLGSRRVALAQAIDLGVFVNGNPGAWPFAVNAPWPHVPALEDDERLQAADDVIGEVALAAGTEPALLQQLDEARVARVDPFLRCWLRAYAAFHRNEPADLLRLTVEHCRTSTVVLPQTTRLIRSCLEALSAVC